MLSPEEQADIMQLANALARTLVRAKNRVARQISSPRMAAASVEKATENLRDYLKEAG